MIAVIADDFTGAAELAGIGLRYDLRIQIAMPGVPYDDAELFIVSTDSRSMNREQAVAVHAKVVRDIIKLKPEFIFKKIDSVLRGHVLDELKIQMAITKQSKALIVAANPSLGRTIKNGVYYVEGKEIHSTGFAGDPEFAITDSTVLKMIRAEESTERSRSIKPDEDLPMEGIVIAEASTKEDIDSWVNKINNEWVMAGAGDFFMALLNKRFTIAAQSEIIMESPHLYVCGTSFGSSKDFVSKLNERCGCVAYMPEPDTEEKWLEKVHQIISQQKRCIIAVGENTTGKTALALRQQMAQLTKIIVEKENIRELFIEGGSTAAAILDELTIKSLIPENELMRGVTRMKAGDLHVTVKPGSYALPSQIISLYN